MTCRRLLKLAPSPDLRLARKRTNVRLRTMNVIRDRCSVSHFLNSTRRRISWCVSRRIVGWWMCGRRAAALPRHWGGRPCHWGGRCATRVATLVIRLVTYVSLGCVSMSLEIAILICTIGVRPSSARPGATRYPC